MDSNKIPSASIDESIDFAADQRESESSESGDDLDFEQGPNPSPMLTEVSMPNIE